MVNRNAFICALHIVLHLNEHANPLYFYDYTTLSCTTINFSKQSRAKFSPFIGRNTPLATIHIVCVYTLLTYKSLAFQCIIYQYLL